MSILRKLAKNVISVDFKNKKTRPTCCKKRPPNPFAICVDENSMNLDDFCNALLSPGKEEKLTHTESGKNGFLTLKRSILEDIKRQTE